MFYAELRNRLYAFFIDYLIIVLYGVFVVGTVSIVFRPYVMPLFTSTPELAELTGFVMITLPVSLYFIVSECSKWQGTLGKRKMRLRVCDKRGHRIGIGRSVIRTGVKFLPWEVAHFAIWRIFLPSNVSEDVIYLLLIAVNVTILFYILIPLTNKKGANVYDWIAGTEVKKA
ncbi:RDD family protein [Guptibacillus algicola]|uniref:RDD family protein n=1 Tax=Guptibacillus algicola TaxID=225844 RepID=UPI001CD40E82|nr:RDD family protein [Alkalihalobacillus algicola]MCA0987399.1 RDD family protein [Alkalihalobacillus algicola]